MSGLCKVEMSGSIGLPRPMEPERIALSQRERDRLKVLHEVEQKHVTQVEAGRWLDLTDRHIRRLLVRLHQHGDGALVHVLRGQPSNRRLPAPFAQRVSASRPWLKITLPIKRPSRPL
jgi:Helix-turn-helix domain